MRCRSAEEATIKEVLAFLQLEEATPDTLAAMAKVQANRGHSTTSKVQGLDRASYNMQDICQDPNTAWDHARCTKLTDCLLSCKRPTRSCPIVEQGQLLSRTDRLSSCAHVLFGPRRCSGERPHMLATTRELLSSFYKPFDEELALQLSWHNLAWNRKHNMAGSAQQ